MVAARREHDGTTGDGQYVGGWWVVARPRTKLTRVKITVGEVTVLVVGPDLAEVTRRATRLLKQAAALSVAASLVVEEEERPHIGFTSHLERAPEFVDRDRADWFEEVP